MSSITIDRLTKSFPSVDDKGAVRVLDELSLTIADGELLAIFGPNGSGKTTLLRIVAGLEGIDSGTVHIGSRTPDMANTGYVIQNYGSALFPWLTSLENILFAFSLRRRRVLREAAREKLHQWLSELGLNLALDRYPYQLSGGQQQMVAILRTLIYEPEVILMDEPFSSLDYATRRYMQEMLLHLWQREHQTVVFVTHDIEEAMFLADRVVLLKNRPTSVESICTLPFARPRTRDIVKDNRFFNLRNELLAIAAGATRDAR